MTLASFVKLLTWQSKVFWLYVGGVLILGKDILFDPIVGNSTIF